METEFLMVVVHSTQMAKVRLVVTRWVMTKTRTAMIVLGTILHLRAIGVPAIEGVKHLI